MLKTSRDLSFQKIIVIILVREQEDFDNQKLCTGDIRIS